MFAKNSDYLGKYLNKIKEVNKPKFDLQKMVDTLGIKEGAYTSSHHGTFKVIGGKVIF